MFIIAELGNTHEGSVGLAKQLIQEASLCGVDAVKIQTHIFEAESLSNAPNPPYFSDETREEYFTRTSFNLDQYISLKNYSESECKVEFLSSPFSVEAVGFLEQVDVNRYKVPSGEVTNIPLLECIAATHKPVLLSSGMSPWNDIDLAVRVLKNNGCSDLSILQCSSRYPCPVEQVGLNVILELSERYGVPVGFSDHTLGFAAPFGAAALGAKIIEKHFTLSTKMYGSDAKHSMEPKEFREMVSGLREITKMLNNPVDKNIAVEDLGDMKVIFEKSIVASTAIKKGDLFTRSNLSVKKPGNGLPASSFLSVLGKKSNCNIAVNEMISESSFS